MRGFYEQILTNGEADRLGILLNDLSTGRDLGNATALPHPDVLRLYLQREYNGTDTRLVAILKLLQELAAIDGSYAWNMMIGLQSPLILSYLPKETYEELYKLPEGVFLTSSSADKGYAVKKAGGYSVSGRWRFGSGSQHANFFMGHCYVTTENTNQKTDTIIATFFKREQVNIIPGTWNVLGLRETNSADFEVTDVFVADNMCFQAYQGVSSFTLPQFILPLGLHMALHMAAIALGIANAVTREIAAFSAKSNPAANKKREYEKYTIQQMLGTSLTRLSVLESALIHAALYVWDNAGTIAAMPARLAELQGIPTYVVIECADIVNELYRYGGSYSLMDGSIIRKCFCDINVITQHANLSPGIFSQIGGCTKE